MIPLMTTDWWQKILIKDLLMKMAISFFLWGDEDDLGDFYVD